MQQMDQHQCLDFDLPQEQRRAELAFDNLFNNGGGCMLGVLECRNHHGQTIVLKAFSSLKGGIRHIPGWVPHLLGERFFAEEVIPKQDEIKSLTSRMEQTEKGSPDWKSLFEKRKSMSQNLMSLMHQTYQLRNFRNESSSLPEAFEAEHGISGKVGQCCAPKLLVHAARSQLTPVGIAEFYWGDGTSASERTHMDFYPACKENCEPILGFILCGLEDK